MKKWLLGFASVAIVILIVVGVLVFVLWANDVRKDRRHVVLVNSQTLIFANTGTNSCGGDKLTLVQSGTSLRVRRIRYWKNCATIDVVLPDGRLGHIVLGEGDVSVTPPLNAYE